MSADRPDWTVQQAETWKLSLPVDRATAERVAAGLPEIDALDPAPVLVVSEPDPRRPDAWQLDAYFEGMPTPEALARVQALADGPAPPAERVADRDWVTESQGFLAPIRAGRFFVHTAAYANQVPADAVPFRVEASRAFGTGHHETTAGCLEAVEALAHAGARFGRIADIGTGTGLLAFAAHAVWPEAAVIASDIDPIAIEVVRENMAVNGIASTAIALAVADGMAAPALAAAAPFDLILANILAGPLIALAPGLAAAAAPGATLILAGLLENQADDVLSAYRDQGYAQRDRLHRGDWAILVLVHQP